MDEQKKMRILVEVTAGIAFIVYGISEGISNWLLIGIYELSNEGMNPVIFFYGVVTIIGMVFLLVAAYETENQKILASTAGAFLLSYLVIAFIVLQ
ncbi:MAG: hypothetical protein ACXAC8_19850 [Candidatus Hodarchaeales archaeon]|jgi:hypothetical protein